MEVFSGLLVFWFICGIAGYMIGGSKGQGVLGFVLGFLLGPIGLLIAFLSAGNRVQCPYCRKMIDPQATKCPYCQSDVAPSRVAHAGSAHSEADSRLDVESELRDLLSEMAFKVFWLHKRRDKIYAIAWMKSEVDLNTVVEVDAACQELSGLGIVREMDDMVPAFPGGPSRRRWQLTDRGKNIGR